MVVGEYEPGDSNVVQEFEVSQQDTTGVRAVKVAFYGSTDFYGRVCVYQLDVIGRLAEQ